MVAPREPKQELMVTPRGLATDINPHTTAPDGSASEALNVWFLRPDTVEPRPGGNLETTLSGNTNDYVVNLYEFRNSNGDTVSVEWRTSASGVTRDGFFYANSEVLKESGGDGLDWIKPFYNFEEYDGYLYLCTADGVRRYDTRSNTGVAPLAGLPRPGMPRADTLQLITTNPYAVGQRASYKLTYSLELSSGRLLESAPSPTFFFKNTAVGAQSAEITHQLVDEVAAGWKVNLYRSSIVDAAFTTTVDEMLLVGEHTVTAEDISRGYVVIEDNRPDAARGRSLYINTSVNGAAKAAFPPPISRCIKSFSGMTFYGNVTIGDAELNILYARGGSEILSFIANTAEISGHSNNFFPGGYITTGTDNPTAASSTLPAFTYLINNGSGSVDFMSENALISTTGDTLFWRDITIDGTQFFGYTSTTGSLEDTADNIFSGEASNKRHTSDFITESRYPVSESLGYQLSAQGVVIDPVENTFNYNLNSLAPFTVQHNRLSETVSVSTTSKTEAFTPGGEIIESSAAVHFPGRLYFSEVGSPDWVPPGNFINIGEVSKAILALAKTRDTLFVFKEDGVFTIRGASPDTLSVDEFDRTLRLVNPRSVVASADALYALTNKGVVRLTESGVDYISRGKIDNFLYQAINLGIPLDNQDGPFVTSWESLNHIFVGVPSVTDASTLQGKVEYLYAYSTKTEQWSRWRFDEFNVFCCVGSNEDTSKFLLGGQNSALAPRYGFLRGGGFEGQNGSFLSTYFVRSADTRTSSFNSNSVTLGDIGGGFYTIDLPGANTPGRVIALGLAATGKILVTDYDSSSGLGTIKILEGTLAFNGLDAVTYYDEGVTWEYETLVRSSKNPGRTNRWHQIMAIFDSLQFCRRIDVATSSSSYDVESEVSHIIPYAKVDITPIPRELRSSVHRNHTFANQLKIKFSGNDADGRWILTGISCTYTPVTLRGGRGL